MELLRRAIVTCLWLLVSACSAPDTEQRLDSYRDAVGALVLTEHLLDGVPVRDVLLPTRRDRRMEVAEHRVGLFDFLALQGCRLGELAGERNSQLGRVMVPSRRLVYELEVLEAADRCLVDLAAQRRAEISIVIERKRAEVPRHIWNAVWEDGELRGFLSVVRSHPAFLADTDRHPEYTLREIERLLARRPFGAEEAHALEKTLGALRGHDTAGALILRLERSRAGLDAISDALDSLDSPGCDTTRRRLVRVFETHYVGRVQPDLAALDRLADPMLETLARLYQASRPDRPPPSMEAFYERVLSPSQGVRAGYRAAVLRHARSWLPTLAACNAMPGGAPDPREARSA